MMLSERMKANCALIPETECMADVGTDHGYVPIFLVRSGVVKRAIAMDVGQGPIQRAEENIRREGLTDRIETRLSDGLSKLEMGEADVVLIAGMGGPLTIRILENGKNVLDGEDAEKDGCTSAESRSGVRALVLQPQSEIPSVRKYLSEHGWKIAREDMVLEDGKFYPMMQAERGKEQLSLLQQTYGPRLLEMRHPVLQKYLRHEEATLEKVIVSLKKAAGSRKTERLEQVEASLRLNHEGQLGFGDRLGSDPDLSPDRK